MASMANLRFVLRNFVWRIEALTPSLHPYTLFRRVDVHRHDQNTMPNRRFAVIWSGSEADHDIDGDMIIDDNSQRPAVHSVAVSVYYQAAKMSTEDLLDMIAYDRHQITKTLRAASNLVGYDDSNPSTDIGLWMRDRESDELDTQDDATWTLTQSWRCVVNEPEA